MLGWDTEEHNGRKAARYAASLLTALSRDFPPRLGVLFECVLFECVFECVLDIELSSGYHNLRLAFANDFFAGGEDRNLMLDKVTFYREF